MRMVNRILLATGAGLSLSNTTVVLAQNTDSLALEEIVVTAQKREETLQKAALSVTALVGDDLRQQGKTDLPDMLRGVAGVETGNGFFFVRGIGSAPQFGQDASVTVSVNGVFMQNAQTQRDAFFDIARVEVARGPQTTLTGRTSEGGAINVISNEPNLDQFELKGVVEGGDHSLLATQGVINLPIGSQVAFRTAFATVNRDGYFTSGGDLDNKSVRARLLWQPSEDIKLILSGDYSDGLLTGTASGNTDRIDLSLPFYTLHGYYWNPTPPLTKSKYIIKNFWGDFTWDTAVGTLYFQPTYQENKVINYPIYSANSVTLFNNLALGYNYDAAVARSTTSSSNASPANSTSYELRFSSPASSKLKWLVGLYYFKGEQAIALLNGTAGTSSPNNATANPANATAVGILPTIGYPVVYPQSNKRVTTDKDVYFQATYPVTKTWRVTGGARYSDDAKKRGTAVGGFVLPDGTAINTNFRFPLDNNATNPGVPNGNTATNGPFIYYNLDAATASYKRVNWLAKLEHDVTDTSMLYAMVSTGWKTGSFINIPSASALCSPPPAGAPLAATCSNTVPLVISGFKADYDPEYLTAYEIGSKNMLLNDRLRVNGSLYYYDYKGFQFNYAVNWVNPAAGVDPDFQPLTGQTGNAKKATSYGGEIETSYLITANDKLDFNVSYIHARLKEVQVSSLAAASVKAWAAALTNFTFPHAPSWQLTPRYSHVFNLNGHGDITANMDAQYSSKQYTNLPSSCQQIPGNYAAGTCAATPLVVDDHVLTYYVQPAFTKMNASVAYHSTNSKWSVTGYINNATNKKTIVSNTPPNSFVGFGSAGFTPDDPRTYGVIVSANL
ncbi:MAG: TonB-dependent receptor [Steroidobacteraceae bacterium]